jgi:3-oxoacyl-[acyl-carrier protein] reductase
MRYLLITGGSRGIGAAIIQKFLAQQWQAINFARSAPNQGIHNVTVDFHLLDQLHEKLESIKNLLQDATQICLVHNAFCYHQDSIDCLESDVFETTLRVNLLAPNLINQHIIPVMPVGSSIVYIGSTLSEKAVPQAASYIIGKHALVGMMRATCQDLATKNIHTCCVAPGFTDTEMLRAHVGEDATILRAIAARVGENRLIRPEEIAELVWFCANNPVINGALLHANLGQLEQ